MKSLFLHPKKTFTLGLATVGGDKPGSTKLEVHDEPRDGDIVVVCQAVTGAEKLEYFADIYGRGSQNQARVYPFLKFKVEAVKNLPTNIRPHFEDEKGNIDVARVIDALDSRPAIDLAAAIAERSGLEEVQLGKSDLPEASSSEDSGSTSATA
jgi:hypothetical protein